jgi:hypothetical protein
LAAARVHAYMAAVQETDDALLLSGDPERAAE